MSPRVTILMGVYNGQETIKAAVGSLLSQSFTDIEVLVVNDGSTDKTGQLLEEIRDPRVIILTNAENIGLTRSLNRGLHIATGEFIARLDADDIAYPERIEKQLAWMESNPQAGVCGTYAEVQGEVWGSRVSSDECLIDWLLVDNIFVHSSVMMRRQLILDAGGYNENYEYAQDYELWARISAATAFGMVREVLVGHRRSADQISQRLGHHQTVYADKVRVELFSRALNRSLNQNECMMVAARPLPEIRLGTFVEFLNETWLRKQTPCRGDALKKMLARFLHARKRTAVEKTFILGARFLSIRDRIAFLAG